MTRVAAAPFSGQIVHPDWADRVIAPAYDSLTVAQRQAFRRAHPDSYLHVTRSAEDEADGHLVDNATLVTRGRASLDSLVEQGAFSPPESPAYLVYRLALDGHSQLGLIAEMDAASFAESARPHESTRAERASLLAEHFATVRAASSPIACALRGPAGLEMVLAEASVAEPVLDVVGDDGLVQTVWRVEDPALVRRIETCLDNAELVIIDGHHRAAANKHLAEQGIALPVLTAIFPEESLQLVGFHRLVRLPEAIDSATFLHQIGRRFAITEVPPQTDVTAGHVVLVLDGAWYRVYFDERPIAGGARIRLGSLDPVVLEREVLGDAATHAGDLDITFIPDIYEFDEIVALASDADRVPIFVPPVSMDDLMAVAAGGVIMPAKSTYFTPKVRSGVFLRTYDEFDT